MNALAEEVPLRHDRLLSTGSLPGELIATDRILQRWAASVGDGTNDHDEVILSSRVSPLPDGVAIMVDQLVLRSPYRKLTELWYRTPVAAGVIAEKLRIPEKLVRPSWRISLNHYRVFFETSPLSDLRKLARIDARERARLVCAALRRESESSENA